MKIYLINRKDVSVFCNDKMLPVLTENGRDYVVTAAVPGETVTLDLVRRSEFSIKGWFLYTLLFWIIGITGLFTPRYSSFTHRLDCSLRFSEDLKGSFVVRFTHYFSKKGRQVPAVTVLENGEAQLSGEFYVKDATASRRRKLYKLFSWAARICVISAAVYAALKFII